MRSGRKGISELVAALIMILIVMAGAIIVYVYSSGMLGSLQGAQPQQGYTDHISLEYYDWTGLTKLDITVRDTGTSVITMVDFFVGNSTWNFRLNPSNSSRVMFGSGCNSPAGQLTIQGVCKVALMNIPAVTRGSGYYVKIVTRTGAIFSYSLIAGSFTS